MHEHTRSSAVDRQRQSSRRPIRSPYSSPKSKGFFREEGLKEYDYDARGLIPGPRERDGLAMAITNRGVDIATAVDFEAAIYRRSPNSDVYIAGGWRYTPFLRRYGAERMTDEN